MVISFAEYAPDMRPSALMESLMLPLLLGPGRQTAQERERGDTILSQLILSLLSSQMHLRGQSQAALIGTTSMFCSD